MKKKRIELEKKEIIFLIGVLEDLAENELVVEEQKEFELLNSIYIKLTKSLSDLYGNDLGRYLYYDHKEYTNSNIIKALEDLNKKGKI